jgi:hypothetical protein
VASEHTGQGRNRSTAPLRQWGFWQCLSFSWTTLRGKLGLHLIAVKGVVDTFMQGVNWSFLIQEHVTASLVCWCGSILLSPASSKMLPTTVPRQQARDTESCYKFSLSRNNEGNVVLLWLALSKLHSFWRHWQIIAEVWLLCQFAKPLLRYRTVRWLNWIKKALVT